MGVVEAAVMYDIDGFGARPNDRIDLSAVFAGAWSALTGHVPRVEFQLGHAAFAGPRGASRVTI